MSIDLYAMPAKYIATTPTSISTGIQAFCADVEPNAEPVYIEVATHETAAIGQCYANVADFCRRFGGDMQFGWLIWVLRGIYMTAEHHAVVKSANGSLLDITPQSGNENRILFLPSSLVRMEKPIINRYRPVKDTPLLNRICALQERNQRLFFAGRMGCLEFQVNDNEVVRLIERFNSIRARNENL